MARDQISVIEPNGVQRTRPITSRGLTIGRVQENDLVIAYSVVSRMHAQVSYEDGRYYVTDLGSANGTYLDDVRLEPNTPTPWLPNQVLRIGQTVINLKQTSTSAASAKLLETVVWSQEQMQKFIGKGKTRKTAVIGILIALLVVVIVAVLVFFVLMR